MSNTVEPKSPVNSRMAVGDDDFWRVRRLLLETYPITPLGFNWDVRRWDGKRFYNELAAMDSRLVGKIRLWETGDGRLVAAAHPEGAGEPHLQVHPDYRRLEPEMIAWAEEHLSIPTDDGAGRQVAFYIYEYEADRERMLAERGYVRMSYGGAIRRVRLADAVIPEPKLADGYTLRTVRAEDMTDCQHIADLLNAAFGRTFHNALEFHNFAKCAPSYRADLDLVAVAPDSSFAAYVGIPYAGEIRSGIFEPVCTHPAHRQRGLAQALMFEGLHRLRELGAVDASVDTGDMIPANALYDSIGFTEVQRGHAWKKVFR